MHLKLDNVSLDFPVFGNKARRLLSRDGLQSTLGGMFRASQTHRNPEVRALDDITFHLRDGDRVALIGHNGAGKSTLLRVLSGILVPTCGRVDIKGTVIPLLSGTFVLELDATGTENIDLGCLYIGLSDEEAEAVKNEIIEFTQLGPYIDMPIRTYSAGMIARLSFGIATSARPDILILDEGVGTGDAEFQIRAAKRLDEFVEITKILVLASHSPSLVERFCDKAIWMDKGRVRAFGPLRETFEEYNASVAENMA